jgi:hypothetical protein
MGDPGSRGRTPPTYHEPTKHTAGVAQAKCRGRAYGMHTQGGKIKWQEGKANIQLTKPRYIRCARRQESYRLEDKEILTISDGAGAGATLAGIPQEGTIHCKWEQRRCHAYSYQHMDARIGH